MLLLHMLVALTIVVLDTVFSEYRLKTGELPTSENMLHVCSDGLKVTSLCHISARGLPPL